MRRGHRVAALDGETLKKGDGKTMSKDTRAANGAKSKKDLLLFDPNDLVIVEDQGSALQDDRAKWDPPEWLILSIMARGVLTPIIVRKNPETDKTEVVDGRQRTGACREANKRLKKEGREPVLIPATVKRTNALDSIAIMVTANGRIDDTPLNRAKKAARYLDAGGTEEDACVMLGGVSKATLKNMIALLDAPAVVRKAVEAEHISVSDGYKLAKLEPEEAAKRVDKLKTEAPRTPGKKRSSNAKKARAIVKGQEHTNGAAAAHDDENGLPSKKTVSKTLKEIEESEAINENKRMGAVAVLKWFLGDKDALGAIM